MQQGFDWRQQQAKLNQVRFQVDDLPGQTVGNEADGIVTLDVNAAGYGWFVDPTPAENEEFNPTTITSQFVADSQRRRGGSNRFTDGH